MSESLERRPRHKELEVASGVESARHDQVMIINRSGEVIDRKASMRQLNWYILPAALVWGAAGTALGLGLIPVVLTGVAATMAPLLWISARWRPLRAAWAQIAAGELDSARVVLEGMARRPPWRGRPVVEQELGRLSLLQGRTEAAVVHYAAAADELRRRRKHDRNPVYWFALAGYGSALAILGRVDAAREVRRELDAAPDSMLFDINRQYIDLRAAFAASDAGSLAGLDLYDWSKTVLATNLFGSNLVLLAWACEQTGDRDMAAHLLGEAPERLTGHFLRLSDPALCAFLESAWKEWGIEGELEIP